MHVVVNNGARRRSRSHLALTTPRHPRRTRHERIRRRPKSRQKLHPPPPRRHPARLGPLTLVIRQPALRIIAVARGVMRARPIEARVPQPVLRVPIRDAPQDPLEQVPRAAPRTSCPTGDPRAGSSGRRTASRRRCAGCRAPFGDPDTSGGGRLRWKRLRLRRRRGRAGCAARRACSLRLAPRAPGGCALRCRLGSAGWLRAGGVVSRRASHCFLRCVYRRVRVGVVPFRAVVPMV